MWKSVLTNPDGSQIAELTRANSPKFTFNLDDKCQATFDIDGRQPQASRIVEMQTDLIVWLNGKKRFRGRIGPSTDDFDATKFATSFTAIDYRGVLARRYLWANSTLLGNTAAFGLIWGLTAQEQTAIAWGLIDATQTTPPQSDPTATESSSLGISTGLIPTTGVVRDRTYYVGDSVGSALDDLGRVIDGYDWEIDADLAFNVYYPQRGSNTGQVLEFDEIGGGNILSGKRTLDTSQFANAQMETSGQSGTYVPGVAEVDVSQMATIGRWEAVENGTSITDHNSAVAKAQGNLDISGDISASYSLVLKPGWWTPEKLWLGDTAKLVIRAGRLNVETPQRVTQVEVDVNDDGGETVTIATGPFIPSFEQIVQQSAVRLDRLSAR